MQLIYDGIFIPERIIIEQYVLFRNFHPFCPFYIK
jgi:hypothetical protein